MYYKTDTGNVYAVANQAAVTTTAALATTWTGLGIANPTASSVNLVLLEFNVAQFAVGAAAAVGLMMTTNSGFAAVITPQNQLVGSGLVASALADDGATIATPVLNRIYGQVGSEATTAYGLMPGIQAHIDGSIVIPPGFAVCSYTSIVTTSALLFNFVWAEEKI